MFVICGRVGVGNNEFQPFQKLSPKESEERKARVDDYCSPKEAKIIFYFCTHLGLGSVKLLGSEIKPSNALRRN